jgi:hypothetical protein
VSREFWPPAEPAQADYEMLRARVLADGCLVLSVAPMLSWISVIGSVPPDEPRTTAWRSTAGRAGHTAALPNNP